MKELDYSGKVLNFLMIKEGIYMISLEIQFFMLKILE